jgi:hypothetical protein
MRARAQEQMRARGWFGAVRLGGKRAVSDGESKGGRQHGRDKDEVSSDEDGSTVRFLARRQRASCVHVCACGCAYVHV